MPVKGPNHLLLLFLALSDLLCGLWAIGNILALNQKWTPVRIVSSLFKCRNPCLDSLSPSVPFLPCLPPPAVSWLSPCPLTTSLSFGYTLVP